jgi:hypothetical protein
VVASATGGQVVFENDQRIFVKEAVTGAADNGSVFMKASKNRPEADLIKRIRLEIKSPNGAMRPLLLGFVPNNSATDGFDYGYDAILTETLPYDASWNINDENYSIQGVGEFDITKRYPLNINLAYEGNVEIALHALENFDTEIDVFVFDSELDIYTLINAYSYEDYIEAGVYQNRFYITFERDTSLSLTEETLAQMHIAYLSNSSEIFVRVPPSIQVDEIQLINILGQTVMSWDAINKSANGKIKIPVANISEGNYIIKVITPEGAVNRKVSISFN